jgi:hypothetical protein
MSESDNLPEYHLTDDRPPQRIAKPTYEALAPCQIIMTSAETGVTGPTMIEAGEVFVTEATPNHQWLPLNRAAGERYDAWLNSLPGMTKNLTLEEISEAAQAMRPREGEPQLAHNDWWAAVMRHAQAMRDKRQTVMPHVPHPAHALRPGGAQKPVMPYMTAGATVPIEPGRAPVGPGAAHHVATTAADGARRARPARQTAPLANATPSESQVQTAT